MYSLGLIFFELWVGGFRTYQELDEAFTYIREHSQVPPKYSKYFEDPGRRGGGSGDESKKSSKAREVIEWLIQADPKERPSTTSLL